MTTTNVVKSYIRFAPMFESSIIVGYKSETRRPDTDYKPGDSLCVLIHRKRIGSLLVLRVKDELLQDMTREDAENEGFVGSDPVADFRHYWDRQWYAGQPTYKWKRNPNVQVVTFAFKPGGAF